MGSFQPIPLLSRRAHRHLDSASYRSLVRIFSFCLDFENSNALECRQDSVLSEKGKDANKGNDLTSFVNGNSIVQENAGILDDLVCAGITSEAGDTLVANVVSDDRLKCGNYEKQQSFDAKDVNADNVNKLANELTNDTPAQDDGLLNELSNCEPGAATMDDDVCCSVNEVEQQKTLTAVISAPGVLETVEFSFCDQLPLASWEELEIEQLTSDLCRVGSSDKSATTQKKEEMLNSMILPSTTIKYDEVSCLEVSCSGLKNLNHDLLNLEAEEDVEEGQIPDDFLSSEQVIDEKANENAQVRASADILSHRPCVGISGNGGLDNSSASLPTMDPSDELRRSKKVYYGDIVSFMSSNDGKQTSKHLNKNNRHLQTEMKERYVTAARLDVSHGAVGAKASSLPGIKISSVNKPSNVEGQPLLEKETVKKKRGGSSEQKKAKRKIAKKRKRAQKEREQGVKRLKLQPIVKPKVVQICNFYLKGRCQQGDLCKFSHDATPLTKSQPCKHLATDSCLKGDDCPYDHDLSKYPCHNIMSKGSCHRGEMCKFSHKVPADDSSLKESASPLLAEKLNLGKGKDALQTAAIGSAPLRVSALQSVHKQSVENSLQPLKEHLRIPKGIRFLSFGNEQSVKKKEDKLLSENGGIKTIDEQNQEICISESRKLEQNFNKKPLPMFNVTDLDSASNAFNLKSVEKRPPITAEALGAKKLENEVSDASKILQEFLFGGIS